jgi:hypothetical protein
MQVAGSSLDIQHKERFFKLLCFAFLNPISAARHNML